LGHKGKLEVLPLSQTSWLCRLQQLLWIDHL